MSITIRQFIYGLFLPSSDVFETAIGFFGELLCFMHI